MPTDIAINSNALVMLGHGTINSLDDTEATANLYDGVYENLLTLHRWRFAVGKKQLGLLVSTPLNDWSNAFQLPADFLSMINVYPRSLFEIYEDKIFTNASEVAIDYLFKPDELDLPAYFVKALEYLCAAEYAIPVTDNRTLMETYELKFEKQLARAKHVDAQGRPNVPIESNPFVNGRR